MPESTMLRFIQILPQVSPKGDFLLKDLPGSGKRIDILCRDLAACFDWGPISWQKSLLEVIAVIGNSKALTFRSPQTQQPLGEVGWAAVIRDSLRGNPPSYVLLSDETLEDVMKKLMLSSDSSVWVLDEEGTPLSDIEFQPTTKNSFMLGDNRGFDSQAMSVISKYDIKRVSLGKKSYLSSHCLAAIISEFEGMIN